MPASESQPRVSVIVLTLNEELTLPFCLASVRNLHAEIFVVDSGSSDRTVEIATAAAARVVTHPFANYAAQRNWAQENLPLRGEWILQLDADERLLPELVDEINARLAGDCSADAFLINRRTIFRGRWMRHGAHYPVAHLRLYRKGKGWCEHRLYDQHFLTSGTTARLRHDFEDHVGTDLKEWTTRHARWAELEAAEACGERGAEGATVTPHVFGDTRERRRWQRDRVYARAPLFVRAFAYWFYRYVLRGGFLDGTEGLIFHFLQGFWFRFLVDANIHERRRGARTA